MSQDHIDDTADAAIVALQDALLAHGFRWRPGTDLGTERVLAQLDAIRRADVRAAVARVRAALAVPATLPQRVA